MRARRRSAESYPEQLKAVRALHDLLSLGLPPTSWTVYSDGPACLHGLLSHRRPKTPDDIAAAHDGMAEWARFLEVDVVERPQAQHETVHLVVEGSFKDVRIYLAAIVPDDGGAWRRGREN